MPRPIPSGGPLENPVALTITRASFTQISDVYMMPAAIIESLSPLTALRRMFLSAAVHGDHYHLYYKCAAQHQAARLFPLQCLHPHSLFFVCNMYCTAAQHGFGRGRSWSRDWVSRYIILASRSILRVLPTALPRLLA